jgi:O-antigen/teichoic acid export membrane protein
MFTELFPKGSLRRLVAGNTLSQLMGRAVSAIVIMIVSLLIARRFGPEGYGDFVKITTYVAFFYLIADFGLNAIYIQKSTEKTAADDVFLWQQLFGLRLVMSAVLVLVAMGLLLVFPQGIQQGYTPLVRMGILLLAPVIIAQAITTTTNAFFQKLLRYDLATWAQNAGSLATLGTIFFLYFLTEWPGAIQGIVGIFCGSVVTACIALLLLSRRRVRVFPLVSSSTMHNYLTSGFPLGLMLLFNLIYFHSDSVVLALTRSTSEVGIYGLAYKVFELPLVLPIFFMNSVYPLIVTASSGKKKTSSDLYSLSMSFLLISALVIAIGLWVTAPLVVYVRPDFLASVAPLRILSLGLPIFFISAFCMWVLIARKQQWVLLRIHAIAMAINLSCNVFFIPRYGYMAAAWITILSELFILCLSLWVMKHAMVKEG